MNELDQLAEARRLLAHASEFAMMQLDDAWHERAAALLALPAPVAALEHDGHALRLAVKHNIDVMLRPTASETWCQAPLLRTVIEPWCGDALAATRRAIARAVADIELHAQPRSS